MIRLNITAEGFSEERFVSDILRPHLLKSNIYVEARKVLTNKSLQKRGGVVGYQKFKNDVTQWFKECPDVYHSCLIDLYGLTTDFPGYNSTRRLSPYKRIAEMERMLKVDLNFPNFIPYIQLHEFETLLFSDPKLMEEWLEIDNELPDNCFLEIKASMPEANPELINESPETAPSKRILRICKSYNKVTDGVLILQEIGLDKLRLECRHFNEWLTILEGLK